jgi:hypothetical protein
METTTATATTITTTTTVMSTIPAPTPQALAARAAQAIRDGPGFQAGLEQLKREVLAVEPSACFTEVIPFRFLFSPS